MIESKVYAATIGSGAGTIISAFVLWLLGITAWHSNNAAGNAAAAIASVPTPVAALVTLALALGGTFLGGYRAPHTSRPDLTPPTTFGIPTMDAPPAVPLLEHFPDPVGTDPAPANIVGGLDSFNVPPATVTPAAPVAPVDPAPVAPVA